MAWIKVYSEIWDSWKIPTMCSSLGIGEAQAVGHLISLWSFVERNAWRDGDLTKWGEIGISKAARWDGNPTAFIKALTDSGFLDNGTMIIHEWTMHQSGMIHDRERRNPRQIPAKSPPNPCLDKIRVDKSREETTTVACPHQDIIDLYHKTLPELAKIKEWTEARKNFLRSRWNEKAERQTLDWWSTFFTKVKASDFLCGRNPKCDFKANLEWLIRPANFVKVIEDNYINQGSKAFANPTPKPQNKTGRIYY